MVSSLARAKMAFNVPRASFSTNWPFLALRVASANEVATICASFLSSVPVLRLVRVPSGIVILTIQFLQSFLRVSEAIRLLQNLLRKRWSSKSNQSQKQIKHCYYGGESKRGFDSLHPLHFKNTNKSAKIRDFSRLLLRPTAKKSTFVREVFLCSGRFVASWESGSYGTPWRGSGVAHLNFLLANFGGRLPGWSDSASRRSDLDGYCFLCLPSPRAPSFVTRNDVGPALSLSLHHAGRRSAHHHPRERAVGV